jgi:hypothetical protein
LANDYQNQISGTRSYGNSSSLAARLAAMHGDDLYEQHDNSSETRQRQHIASRAGLALEDVPALEQITKSSHPEAYAAARAIGYLVNEERQAETKAQKAKREAFLTEYAANRPKRDFL